MDRVYVYRCTAEGVVADEQVTLRFERHRAGVAQSNFGENAEGPKYAVDSLPVPVCDNIRIRRCRLYPCPKQDKKNPEKKPEGFRGYVASKKRYFYGLKVHLLVTTTGPPVEVMLAPGTEADISAFKCLPLDLPEQAHIFADAGYLDDQERALLEEAATLPLIAARRANCKEQLLPWVSDISKHERKRVETVFSQIVSAFGRTIHAGDAARLRVEGLLDCAGLHSHSLNTRRTRTAA